MMLKILIAVEILRMVLGQDHFALRYYDRREKGSNIYCHLKFDNINFNFFLDPIRVVLMDWGCQRLYTTDWHMWYMEYDTCVVMSSDPHCLTKDAIVQAGERIPRVIFHYSSNYNIQFATLICSYFGSEYNSTVYKTV